MNLPSLLRFSSMALWLLGATLSQAQTDTRKFTNLGPNINSTSKEINPHVSADGKTLFYVREGHADNKNFQDIWVSEQDEKGKWKPAYRLEKPLNEATSNSVISVSINGSELLIRGFYKNGKLHGTGYSTTKRTTEGWTIPQGVVIDHHHNLDKGKYNNACLSNDDKIMIFSFCTEVDGMDNDIFISFRKPTGTYTEPKKLSISAKGNMDFAPFLASDNKTLYFSSDRPGGLGETDIYKCERLDSTWLNWSAPENLGPKFNGPGRDGYFVLDARGTHAYMVSDLNAIGASDIVMIELEEKQKPKPVVLVRGTIYDAKTKKPIAGYTEYHEYPEDTVSGKIDTDPNNGQYTIIFPYGEKYVISAHAHGYVAAFDTLSLKLSGEYQEIVRDYYLTPIEIGSVVVLNHVNFATDSWVLEDESFPELDKVVTFMVQNPEVEIMIGGHTDNDGTPEHNQELSDNRARVVMEYILERANGAITPARITAKGFGQNQPIVPNTTPENKRKNRRVEFTIVKD